MIMKSYALQTDFRLPRNLPGRARRSARAENGVEENRMLRRARSDAAYP